MPEGKYEKLISVIEAGDHVSARMWAQKLALDVQQADKNRASRYIGCPHCGKGLWVRVDRVDKE
jgi:hypothetical protein